MVGGLAFVVATATKNVCDPFGLTNRPFMAQLLCYLIYLKQSKVALTNWNEFKSPAKFRPSIVIVPMSF